MQPLSRFLPLVSLALLAASSAAEVVERVVARVNGDIVTLSDFEARQIADVQSARVTPDRIEVYLRDNNRRILQDAIDEVLILQRGAEIGIRLRPEYIAEVIEGIKKENNITDDAELRRQLRREGVTLEALKRNIERSIVRRQVLSRELEGRTQVTDVEARKEYEAHKAEYAKSASVQLQEILVKDEALAKELAARARQGEEFPALARQYSVAPSKAGGGELGRLNKGEMNAQLEAAAFALPVGGISEPLRTDQGWRIIKVMEKSEGSVVPFEEAKAELVKRLAQERANRAYEGYVEGLRKDNAAGIRVMVSEVPLQLSVPTPGASPGAPATPSLVPAPVLGADPSEFGVTPQARPERVVPPEIPGAVPSPSPAPSPAPVPSPTPPTR
jgi:peptidyl-prolyl cis-trans isomerase SurA